MSKIKLMLSLFSSILTLTGCAATSWYIVTVDNATDTELEAVRLNWGAKDQVQLGNIGPWSGRSEARVIWPDGDIILKWNSANGVVERRLSLTRTPPLDASGEIIVVVQTNTVEVLFRKDGTKQKVQVSVQQRG